MKLPARTSANVDARLCQNEVRGDEDMRVRVIELFVQLLFNLRTVEDSKHFMCSVLYSNNYIDDYPRNCNMHCAIVLSTCAGNRNVIISHGINGLQYLDPSLRSVVMSLYNFFRRAMHQWPCCVLLLHHNTLHKTSYDHNMLLR